MGRVGGVSQAQRVLYGRRPLAGVGHGRRSGAERGCTSTSAPEVPAPAVAGLDGPIAAPAPRVDPVRRGPGTRSRSGSGRLGPRPSASRLIAGAGPPRQRRKPERVTAKQRAVSSSSARAGTRTVTLLRSLPLPPGLVPAAPGHTSPGALSSTVRPGRRRSRTARRRSRPRGRARRSPDRSRRRWASAGGRLRLALPAAAPGARRHIAVSPELLQQRCGPVQMIPPLRCRSRSGTQHTGRPP